MKLQLFCLVSIIFTVATCGGSKCKVGYNVTLSVMGNAKSLDEVECGPQESCVKLNGVFIALGFEGTGFLGNCIASEDCSKDYCSDPLSVLPHLNVGFGNYEVTSCDQSCCDAPDCGDMSS